MIRRFDGVFRAKRAADKELWKKTEMFSIRASNIEHHERDRLGGFWNTFRREEDLHLSVTFLEGGLHTRRDMRSTF